MTRVFTGLVLGNLLVLLATGAWGLLHPAPTPDRHIVLAVFSLLLTAFVQALTFTYFTVTGKIVGQAVHLAGHDAAALTDVKQLKRSVSHHLLLLLLAVVAVTVTGASHWRTNDLSTLHLLCAAGFLPIAGTVFLREHTLIVRNGRVLAPAMRAYERWERDRQAKRAIHGRSGNQPRGSVDGS